MMDLSVIGLCLFLMTIVDVTCDNRFNCLNNTYIEIEKTVFERGEELSAYCSHLPICSEFNLQLMLGEKTLSLPHKLDASDNNKKLTCVIKDGGQVYESKGTLIEVGVKPTPVEKINCVSWNYKSLNCSFWPKSQDTGIPTVHHMMYACHSFNDNLFGEKHKDCSNLIGNTCVISDNNYYRSGYCSIKVVIENKLGTTEKQSVFHLDKIVKLESVSSLTVVSAGQTWLNLSWKKPYAEHFRRNTTYNFILANAAVKLFYTFNVTSAETLLKYTKTGLVPYLDYVITVRAFPHTTSSLLDAGYWSDDFITNGTTNASVPGAAPKTLPGAFRLIGDDLEIFWEAVPAIFLHGDPLAYWMRLFPKLPENNLSCTGQSYTWEVPANLDSDTQHLTEKGPFDLCIDLKNHVGFNSSLALQPVRILQPGVNVPKFYVSEGSAANISVITILERAIVTNYTVYWCHSFNMETCLNKKLLWQVLDGSEMEFSVNHSMSVQHIAMALSAEITTPSGDIISSGMQFAKYIYDKKGSVMSPPTQLKLVNANARDGSLILSWIKPDWKSTIFIDHFSVDYCLKEQCVDPESHQNIQYKIQGELDGSSQTEAVHNLTEEMTYMFRIYSVGDGTRSSPTTELEVLVPKSGLSKGLMIGIIIICIVAAILVSAGVYYIVKICRRIVVGHPPVVIVMPEVNSYEENGNDLKPYEPVGHDYQHVNDLHDADLGGTVKFLHNPAAGDEPEQLQFGIDNKQNDCNENHKQSKVLNGNRKFNSGLYTEPLLNGTK